MAGRRQIKTRRRGPRGAPPGTLAVDPNAPRPVVRVIAYGPDECVEKTVDDLDSLGALLSKLAVTWVNVDGLGDAATLEELGEIFGLHRLALEDVIGVHQRPKVEQYGELQFIVVRMLSLAEALQSEQVSLFLGSGFVITFQERAGDCLDPVRDRIRNGKGRIRERGCDYLAYALVDAIVDGYFPVLEQYGEQLEALEDQIVGEPRQQTVSRIHDIKRDLLTVRRAVFPLRESVNSLARDPTPLITDDTRIYLRDCYDHTIQVLDMVETYRELTSGLHDVYLSSVSNRMNEVMKVLTIIATIFIPLTFIAGIYGMNLDMPEAEWPWAYAAVWGVMIIVAGCMLVFFRRKKWL